MMGMDIRFERNTFNKRREARVHASTFMAICAVGGMDI